MGSAFLEGPLLCVSSGLGHWLLSLVAYHQLAKTIPSVKEKDLLYAANWAVSLLQASVVTVIGIVGCIYTGFNTRATDLPVNQNFQQVSFNLLVTAGASSLWLVQPWLLAL